MSGCCSFAIWRFHSILFNAIGNHACRLPFGYFCVVLVVCSPVLLSRVVVVSVIISGRSVLVPCISAFLFVVSTPPDCHGLLLHAGMSRLGVVSGPHKVFPR